jgi:hypothetical protein
MNKKIIAISAIVLILAVGFLYLNSTYLAAGDKGGQDTKKECTGKCKENKDIKAGGELGTYDFITDKASSDEMKSSIQKELLTVNGVKEVKFGGTCNISKMTSVTVYYSANETSSDKLASYVKDKSFDCSGKDCTGKGCDKDGKSSGKSSEQMKQSGKSDCPNGCKNCKNKNGKDI